ncbi:hypothetical protein NLO88_15190 [Pseudomonas syringae]|nr:hypothetical protein [Pseudomonas syringae]
MTINDLIEHLTKFVNGSDISLQWAKDAEALLDEIGENEGFGEFESFLMNCRKSFRFIGQEAESIL